MSELISGKEALMALANGEDVEWRSPAWLGDNWHSVLSSKHTNIGAVEILKEKYYREDTGSEQEVIFRLKPRTITINGVEVPKPTHMEWDKDKDPNSVTITFNSESEAKKAHESLGKIMFNAP